MEQREEGKDRVQKTPLSSTSSDESGPKMTSADSTDSGAVFTFTRAFSDSTSIRRKRYLSPETTVQAKAMDSISQCVSLPNYLNVPGSYEMSYVNRKQPPSPDGSIYGTEPSISMTEEEKKKLTRRNMTLIYSCIYGIFLTVMGATIYVGYQSQQSRYISEIFSCCISLGGLMWLFFFHIDLYRYKDKVRKNLIDTSSDQIDRISTITGFNYAVTFMGNEIPPYRFLTGRHSGSFYLKIGLAAFCFGHLISSGLELGQEILFYVQDDNKTMGCSDISSILMHLVRPIYSFHQLFIVFKYSNIVINRHKGLASFALMHIIATCLCFWFGTIVQDALEDYHNKLGENYHKLKDNKTMATMDEAECTHLFNVTKCKCFSKATLSINDIHAIPYLYPFTIEFNLLLAGVWFIMWNNIGKEHHNANPHHFHHKIQRNEGVEEITYQSNLVISADCHASNKGLFAGLFLLLSSIISIIVFFVAMSIEGYQTLGVSIHYVQEGALTILTMLSVFVGYGQLAKLDFNQHPITFLDDVLLIVPLPFFFVQSALTLMSEFQRTSTYRMAMAVLVPLQVVLQTPFIIDGLRRCSNSQSLRYKKPGREIVTFLIVCNLTMWVINTFEAKSVEKYYGENTDLGEYMWLFVSHTTLPLMLFYRFHASVCLSDIWKSAYEKGE